MPKSPADRSLWRRSYSPGVGLAVADAAGETAAVALAVAEAVAVTEAVADAVADPVTLAEAEPDADADPLGTGVVLGVGLGLGDGKSELGTFANERANINTKMTITIATQVRARLSVRGGSEPRYPEEGASGPRSGAERR